jgi:hypothetical protein
MLFCSGLKPSKPRRGVALHEVIDACDFADRAIHRHQRPAKAEHQERHHHELDQHRAVKSTVGFPVAHGVPRGHRTSSQCRPDAQNDGASVSGEVQLLHDRAQKEHGGDRQQNQAEPKVARANLLGRALFL